MPEILVSPIRPGQIPQAACVMAGAFADAPRYTYLLPDASMRYARLPWLLEGGHPAPPSIPAALCMWPRNPGEATCWESLSGPRRSAADMAS